MQYTEELQLFQLTQSRYSIDHNFLETNLKQLLILSNLCSQEKITNDLLNISSELFSIIEILKKSSEGNEILLKLYNMIMKFAEDLICLREERDDLVACRGNLLELIEDYKSNH